MQGIGARRIDARRTRERPLGAQLRLDDVGLLGKSRMAIWQAAYDSCRPATLSGDPQIAVGSGASEWSPVGLSPTSLARVERCVRLRRKKLETHFVCRARKGQW
jgi:hypothetical protein